MTTYHWEIQRRDPTAILGWRCDNGDPRGAEESPLYPDDFAHSVLHRHGMRGDEDRRCVVWDVPGVGLLPVATSQGRVT